MSSVLVWVEGEAETLNELVDSALSGLAAAVLTSSSCLLLAVCHALNEINYCSIVCVEEDFSHSELDLRVDGSVLFYYVVHEYLLHLDYVFIIYWFWWVVVWILDWSVSPLVIEDPLLFFVVGGPLLLESLEVHSLVLLTHFNFADFAPVFGFPGLHADGPVVALCADELDVNFTWTDYLHLEGSTADLSSSFD